MKRLVILICLIVASFARKGFGPTDQEWGYVTVRPGAHMFWWLHRTTANVTKYNDRPLIIWLQGGPGGSSTGIGNFHEIGPLDENLNTRKSAWTNDYNVLFVDNPVGAGYSYVDDLKFLTKNNQEIADDFLVLMQGFYERNAEFVGTPLYIFSQSYGGKMAVDIALTLNKAKKAGTIRCNLKAVGLGDSWISPIDLILTWPSYLQNFGIIETNSYERLRNKTLEIQQILKEEQFSKATNAFFGLQDMIDREVNSVDFYNIINRNPIKKYKGKTLEAEYNDLIADLMKGKIKKALNVSVTWGAQAEPLFETLEADFMKPVIEGVEQLLNSTDIEVVVYNGQLDLIVDTPGVLNWVNNLNWKYKNVWNKSSLIPINVDGFLEGYFKKLGRLNLYLINRAGHNLPADNPTGMSYILKDVISL